MDIDRLQRETSAAHKATEAKICLMDPDLTAKVYIASLHRIYGVVSVWEKVSGALAASYLEDLLSKRRRLTLLEDDLNFFGMNHVSPDRPTLPTIDTQASLLGAMYVMEGSTLGGQYIANHVEKTLGLRGGRGNAYFRGHGKKTGLMWKQFLEVLCYQVDDEDSASVIRTAQEMFAVFGRWMQWQESLQPIGNTTQLGRLSVSVHDKLLITD